MLKNKNIKNEYKLYFRLLKYTNKNLILFAICTLISGIAIFLIFSSIGVLLQNIIGIINGEINQNYLFNIIYILFIFIFALLSSFSDLGFVYIEQNLQILLRNKMLDSFFKTNEFSAQNYSDTEILNRITEDVNQSTYLINYYMSGFIFQPILSGIFSIILLYIIDWRIVLLCIICTLSNFIFSRVSIKWLRKIKTDIINNKSDISNFIQECIDGAIEVRTFKLYNIFKYKLYDKLENTSNKIKKFTFWQGIRQQLSNLSTDCFTIIALMFLGSILAKYEIIEFSNIMLSIPLSDQIGQMMMAIGNFTTITKQKAPHLERVFEIIDLPPECNNEIKRDFSNIVNKNQISFENVSFSYSEKKILNQINFTINKGEKIAFVGESGSGKSTIIKILLGLYIPKGKVKVFNLQLGNCNIEEWRNNFSYLSQDISLFDLTIEENITLGVNNCEQLYNASKMSNVEEFIFNKQEGYKSKLKNGNTGFSGGQIQRIALARCFFKKSPIILMDEPTSALDKISEEVIKNIIEKISDNVTIIVVTHKLNLTKNFDRIYVLDNGYIIENGCHDELLQKNGKYSYIWELQNIKDD